MWEIILAVLQALAAYLRYRFDPEMVKRRDALHKTIALEVGHDAIDKALINRDTLTLAFFISEFMRRQTKTNSPAGWVTDLLNRKLPSPRNEQDRNKDPQTGIDIGE